MSYTSCVYRNCANKSSEISMFRFPVYDPGRLILWIRNSGNLYLDSLSNEELRRRYICAAHFMPSSIHKGSMRSRLIGPAVPVPFQSDEGPSNTTHMDVEAADETDENGKLPSPEHLKVKTPTKFYKKQTKRHEPAAENTSTPSSSNSYTGPQVEFNTPTQRLSRKCMFEGPKRRLSRKCMFEANTDDSPKTKCLKRTASTLLRKNKAQRSQISRLRAKTKKTFSNEFRTQFSKTLALMQFRKKEDKKKWTTEEKSLCLSLFYKSPATYTFLRKQGVVLAAPSTIRLWLSKSDCLPGLCPDIFSKIQKRFENSTIKEKACVICFDEMSIMANLEYNKKYDFVEGFEDLGGNHRNSKIAKYALVFLVRSLYGQWKLPVAYFLSSSNVKADMLLLLLKAIINKLFEHGLLPKVVVCDQASTNQNVFKKMGVSHNTPYFFCNGRKLFAMFDVPHLIKNIRNNFLLNDYIIEKEQMSFQDIVKTYEIDKTSNMSRSLTKLTERHINPNSFQKMTVSLATQIFSNSVAAAIKTAKITNQLNSDTADATANFLKIVNNWFDALNSRNRYDRNPYRHALSKKSTYALQAINDAKNVFKTLHKISYKKDKNNQNKKKLTRPPCFDGVLQSCQAVLQLLNEETSDPTIKYIITRKLNQDVIENLFARFRQKSGSNRNPASKVLRSIFRSNLINSLIKLPQTKNCEDEDGIYVQLPDGEPTQEQANKQTQIAGQADLSSTVNPIAGPSGYNQKSLPFRESIASISTSKKNVSLEECSVTYFAGYLAKICIDKKHCELCAKNLLKEIDLQDKTQMLILNKSYDCCNTIKLKMPSDDLLKVVRIALECLNWHLETIVHSKKIKARLLSAVVDFLKCEDSKLLNVSCQEHIIFLLDHMILVKLHFYCKNKKTNILAKTHPKLRILKNK